MDIILESLAKIGFDWRMALFNLINFLILFFILKKYAFGPVLAILKERHAKVTESVENITKAKTELSMAQQKAQEITDKAKVQGNKLIEQAHDDAKMLSEEMKEKAKADIELLISQAKKNIAIDKAEMKEQLKGETAGLVVEALTQVLGDKFDKKSDEKYIQGVVASLK